MMISVSFGVDKNADNNIARVRQVKGTAVTGKDM